MAYTWHIALTIDKSNSRQPIYRQIVDSIKQLIDGGTLLPGSKVPSSRALAQQLSVNRQTVVKAMEILIDDGWLLNNNRSGLLVRKRPSRQPSATLTKEAVCYPLLGPNKSLIDDGLPDSKLVPFTELSRAYRQLFNRSARWQVLGYGNTLGCLRFREALSEMLNQQRGLHTIPDEICTTRGSQMALYLTANSILQHNDVVIMETPCYERALNTFKQAGITVVQISVETDGINLTELESCIAQHNVKAIYLTPQHQYPTTVRMSLDKQIRLVDICCERNILVIEDDYDSEFYFTDRMNMPIASMLPKDLFVYIGSFSKIISPAIRVGYIHTSGNNMQRISSLRNMIDVQGDNIMELALLQLMENGTIRRHLRKVNSIYKQRRNSFALLLTQQLSHLVSFTMPESGLAFYLRFKHSYSHSIIVQTLLEHHLNTTFYHCEPGKWAIRVGFGSLNDDKSIRLINSLKSALDITPCQ